MLSEEDSRMIQRQIQMPSRVRDEYKKIEETANASDPDRIRKLYELQYQKDCYERMESLVSLWGTNGNTCSFSVPEQAAYAKFVITLPAEEWNPKKETDAVWEYSGWIPVHLSERYQMSFEVIQRGKFIRGLEMKFCYYDENHKFLENYSSYYNKKSWVDVRRYNLQFQCDAICYWITKERRYAEKAKLEMLHFMDDFCQGAEYWMMYDERPEGCDSYGGVQAGRDMAVIAVSYSLIRDSLGAK